MKALELIPARKQALPKDDEFLWRYFDLHKFLNLLQCKTFRFARMDQFEDPLEGIPLSALIVYHAKLDRNLIQNITLSELILDPNLAKDIPEELRRRLNAINGIQKSTFVSCWFYEQRESVAMWNLYSNPDGIAVKIPFGNIKKLLKVDQDDISAYYGGLVDYQDFTKVNPFQTNSALKTGKVALRKDKSFSHEKEFRFVIRTNTHKTEYTGIDSAPINLKRLGLQVVCHPRMPAWKKENIRGLLKVEGMHNALAPSQIQLR
jgi:hypothetical protein